MKTIVKAVLGAAIAVFLAFAFTHLLMSLIGLDPETNALDDFGDMMLHSRSLFVERSEQFQSAAAALQEQEGLTLLATSAGKPVSVSSGTAVPAAEVLSQLGIENSAELAEEIEQLFAGAEVSSVNSDGEELTRGFCRVQRISVRDWGVEFYTDFHEQGCVGILYAAEGGTPPYQLVELVEDWQLFYVMQE